MDGRAIPKNVSLYPTDVVVLEEIAQRQGSSLSGAIRFVLREWLQFKPREAQLLRQAQIAEAFLDGKITFEEMKNALRLAVLPLAKDEEAA